jgi:hypothetical protein
LLALAVVPAGLATVELMAREEEEEEKKWRGGGYGGG